MTSGPDRASEFRVQGLNGVGRVQQPAHLSGEGIERHHLAPGPSPTRGNGRVFGAPGAFLESGQGGLSGCRIHGAVDLLQRRRHGFAVLVGDELQAVPEKMNNAGLDRRLREDSRDRLGKALQAIDHGDQHVFDAAVLEFGHDAQPELGPFGLLDPQAQDLLGAIGPNPERDMDSLVADQSLVADLHPQRVKEDQRVDRIEWAGLPGRDLVQNGIRDRADQVGRDLDAIQLAQMPDDLARAHAPGIHRDHLVIEAGEAALILGNQLGIEAGLAIARDLQIQLAGVGDHRLATIAVAAVAGPSFAREMVIHLGIQDALGERLLQAVEKAVRIKRRLGIGPSRKLVQDGIRNMRLFASRHGWAPFHQSCPPTHEIPDSLETVFGDIDLSDVKGLDRCQHDGPSTIDHRTLQKSGPLPLVFLRGIGLPDTLIEYLPSLLNQAIQFYSCFISYSTKDQGFAERLHADLQSKGVRCWFAPHDMPIGAKILDSLDEAIRLRDKVLLVLSEPAIASDWVEDEVTTAFEEERRRSQTVLFP